MVYTSEISKEFKNLLKNINTENKISLEIFPLPKNKVVYWFSVDNSQYAVVYDKTKSDFTIFDKNTEIKLNDLELALNKAEEYMLSCSSK